MPLNLATQEAEIRRIVIWSQTGQIVHETLSQKKTITKEGWWSISRCKSWVQAPVLKKKMHVKALKAFSYWFGRFGFLYWFFFFFLLYVHICQCGVITYIGYIYKFKKMSYLELVSVQNKYTPNLYKVEAGLLDRTSISYCI
jgi:hypothetical protein